MFRGGLLLCFLLALLSRACCADSAESVIPDFVARAVEEWEAAGRPSAADFPGNHGEKLTSASLTSKRWSLVYSDSDVEFHLYTKSNESDLLGRTVALDKDKILDAGWNSSAPTRIIIHGFANDVTCDSIQLSKNAYLATGNYNVIGVDWSPLCEFPFYLLGVVYVYPTASRVAKFVDYLVENNLTETSQIHIIGHSLGAHVAGVAARELTVGNLSRVTGLDPALPLYEFIPSEFRFASDVAEVVDVIHTSGGGLGFLDPLGDVDFYPNGGCHQPGCGTDTFDTCSHGRSFEYFAESISDRIGFLSGYCTSESYAESGNCSFSKTAVMGDELQYSETGLYYLKTNSTSPYNLAV